MEMPLADFNSLDLERELYARAKDLNGTKQQRSERLLAARQEAERSIPWRDKRAPIAKFEARVQLEDFAELQTYNKTEWNIFNSKFKWRMEQVRRTADGADLEYFHAAALSRIECSKTYVLHMDEFLVRRKPYVHKIFVIFMSRTNGQEHKLCYARSLYQQRNWEENAEQVEYPLITDENIAIEAQEVDNLQTTLITPENIAQALTHILSEIKLRSLKNYVAIICDPNRLNLAAATHLVEANKLLMPPCMFDIGDLHKSFQEMFCSACVRCSLRVQQELFEVSTHEEQLNSICNSNPTKNVRAILLLMDYVNRLPEILRGMWQFEEHQDKLISLAGLDNETIKIYGSQVSRQLPPISYENCAAGAGVLQLLVFDTLSCISASAEPEEIT